MYYIMDNKHTDQNESKCCCNCTCNPGLDLTSFTKKIKERINGKYSIMVDALDAKSRDYMALSKLSIHPYLFATSFEQGRIQLDLDEKNPCRTLEKANIYLGRDTIDHWNAIRCYYTSNLSKNRRIKIDQAYDMFESIQISCLHPNDIYEVTLFLHVDSYESTTQEDVDSPYSMCLSGVPSPFFREVKQINEKTKTHYIPIKTIKNPQSNLIKFFELPLYHLTGSSGFSIEIKLNSLSGLENTCVQMNYLLLSSEVRRTYQMMLGL